MTGNEEDAAWFRSQIDLHFGQKGQTALALFMQEAGDRRDVPVILRSIQNWLSGRNRVNGEMRALLGVIGNPHRVPEMIKRARKVRPEPEFKLIPKKQVPVAPEKWGRKK